MKKILVAVVVLSLIIASVAGAQDETVVEISTSMTDGKWDRGRPLVMTPVLDGDGNHIVRTDAEVPDHNGYSEQDNQIWNFDVGGVWLMYSFSAKAEGLKGQYAIRTSRDGDVWTDWVPKVLGKMKNPRSG